MRRTIVTLVSLLSSVCLWASDEKRPSHPSFDYGVARAHEIEPHRRTIPSKGVRPGFNQLHLTLTVSPTGDVVDAEPSGDNEVLKFWPQLQDEVRQWKFTPFEESGIPVTAEFEEYIETLFRPNDCRRPMWLRQHFGQTRKLRFPFSEQGVSAVAL